MTPDYIMEMAVAICARDLTSRDNPSRLWGADPNSPEVLGIAHRIMRAPQTKHEQDNARDFLAYAWAAFGALERLGWRRSKV